MDELKEELIKRIRSVENQETIERLLVAFDEIESGQDPMDANSLKLLAEFDRILTSRLTSTIRATGIMRLPTENGWSHIMRLSEEQLRMEEVQQQRDQEFWDQHPQEYSDDE